MNTAACQRSKRTIFRSNSSRGSLFPKTTSTIDGKISRTFSLSSSDCDDDRFDRFDDEENRLVEETSVRSLSSINQILPPDLRVPLEISHVPRKASGFFMETMIRRDETKTRFVMYLQSTEGAHPIFCAQKYDGGQIIIKSVHDSNDDEIYPNHNNSSGPPILGSLVKKKKRKKTTNNNKNANIYTATSTICYELLLHESVDESSLNDPSYQIPKKTPPLVVATIDYEQMSKARYLIEGSRPRRASVSILGREYMRAEMRIPNQQSNGQKVLDFGGRGLETSSKNTQLVIRNDGCNDSCVIYEESPCLQMVKWKDHEFNLDFSAPFNAFHAFAFALAQFDF